ncbi:MAG: T9SS type A sorting domain-containing protein [Chlorobiota bacterium]
MKYILALFIFVLSIPTMQAQNLVTDGSFENYIHLPVHFSTFNYSRYQIVKGDMVTNCLCDRGFPNTAMIYPFGIDKYTDCIGWFNGSYQETPHVWRYATSDYFHRDVNPNDNYYKARYADVPLNHANAEDLSDNPLTSSQVAEPYDGDAYVGIFSTRTNLIYYNEFVTQRLDASNPENFIREGGIYDISFRVRKTQNEQTSYHDLKQISMFLWYEIPDLNTSYRIIYTDTLQRNYFMINQHNNPSGFIDDTNWVLVRDTLIAPHDLNYIFIGSFDKSREMADTSHFFGAGLIDPPTSPSTDWQITYHYIDDVKIDSIGFIDTCDCDDITNDISFRSETRGEPGECCRVIYLKLDNQDTTCRISEFIWDTDDGDFIFDTVNVNDLGHLQLKNNQYFPVDTICYDDSLHSEVFQYRFYFRTLGSKEFDCLKIFYDSLDCYDLPCSWLKEPYPDPNDPTKQAVRLDVNYLGTNDDGQCCYELEFINNSPYDLNASDINFDFKGATVTNISDLDLRPVYPYKRYNFFPIDGFEANSTRKIVQICLYPGESLTFDWALSNSRSESGSYDCFDKREVEISCEACCPEFELFNTFSSDTTKCCITIDSANVNCGDSVAYFKIYNDIEIPVSLPYELCNDNSDFKFRVKIYNSDTLFCVKNFDFNNVIDDCSCCSKLFIGIMKDVSYTGVGCKYFIDRIYGSDECGIDSLSAEIEYGKYVDGVYTKVGTMDYTDYYTWQHTMNTCQLDTMVFKFIEDSTELCEKELILQCQTCEDIEVDSVNSYKKSFTYGIPPNHLTVTGCCIDIEVMNPDSGSCDYYGIFETGNGVRDKINIGKYQDNLLKGSEDTLTICGGFSNLTNNDDITLMGYLAIYDRFGNLLCTINYEHFCEGDVFAKETKKSNSVDLEQILVEGNSFSVDTRELLDFEYEIYTIEGKLLYREKISNKSNSLIISTVGLQTGIYTLNLISKDKQIVKIFKVVK